MASQTNTNGGIFPALNLIANIAGLYPPLSGLPLAASALTSAVSAFGSPTGTTFGFGSVNPMQAPGLCTFCGIRPRHVEGMKLLPFCGKTCAANAGAFQTRNNQPSHNQTQNHGHTQSSTAACSFCHLQPRFYDGTKLHPYCSKVCATKAKANQGNVSSPIVTGSSHLCAIPGCRIPAYRDNATGAIGRYCSKAHKMLSEEACLTCCKAQKKFGHFCSKKCANDVEKKAPIVLEIAEGHVTFRSVAEQFKASWKNASKPCPAVRKVYKIISTQKSCDKYDSYRDAVEARGNFKSASRARGNENRRWHATKRECNFGDGGQTQPCSSVTCALCCIVKTSFDLGKMRGAGTFGAGIYSSATSSKSDGYSVNGPASNLKAMMLNKVVVGKAYKLHASNTSLTSPPAGYDSVIAEKGSGIVDDELVVFTNDAIRPSYLVMYDA